MVTTSWPSGRGTCWRRCRSRTRSCSRRWTTCSGRQAEVERLNDELAETNRGVVALYAELDEKAESLEPRVGVQARFLSDVTHERARRSTR